MEKSTRIRLLDAGLDLLGREGFRKWSLRAVEDEAGAPHGSVRHHFTNQQGLVRAMLKHLLATDMPRPYETVADQVRRWAGSEAGWTRARYELIVASFHDHDLAIAIISARDELIETLSSRISTPEMASITAFALDGLVLDALLRQLPADTIPTDHLIGALQDRRR